MTVGDFHLGRVFHMTAGRSDSYSPPLEGRWNAASSVASAATAPRWAYSVGGPAGSAGRGRSHGASPIGLVDHMENPMENLKKG